MKKLLVLLAIIALFGCEKEPTCWACSITTYERVEVPNPNGPWIRYEWQWIDGGIEKFCDEQPVDEFEKVKYDCIIY